MQRFNRLCIVLAAVAFATQVTEAQPAPQRGMVEVHVPLVDGDTLYPLECQIAGDHTYWTARVGQDTARNLLFHVSDKGLAPVLLDDSTQVRGDVLRTVPGTPYIFRKQGDQSAYLHVNGAKAKVIAFKDKFTAGAAGQHFCSSAPELLWDAVSQALYFIKDGAATVIDQKGLTGITSLDACKVADGFLLIETAVAAKEAPRAWLLNHDPKLQALSFDGLADLNTLLLFKVGGNAYVLAGTPSSGTIFTFTGGKLIPLLDPDKQPVSGVNWLSVAASETTMYFARDSAADESELWQFRAPNHFRVVRDKQGKALGASRIAIQQRGDSFAIAKDAEGQAWVVSKTVAMPLVDSKGTPFSEFDAVACAGERVWFLATGVLGKGLQLYVSDSTGVVHPAVLPNRQLAAADTSVQRVPGGAGILEGMEITGDGLQAYCRRWTATGCRLYALKG